MARRANKKKKIKWKNRSRIALNAKKLTCRNRNLFSILFLPLISTFYARVAAADDFVQNTKNFAAERVANEIHMESSSFFFFFHLSFSSTLTSLALSTLITRKGERKRSNFPITSTWRMHDFQTFSYQFFFYMKNSRSENF